MKIATRTGTRMTWKDPSIIRNRSRQDLPVVPGYAPGCLTRREQVVPVLIVVEVPGGSSALDEALMAAWNFSGSPPPGNRLRLAGPMDDGWRVVSLWDSREQFQKFLRDHLQLQLDGAGDRQPTVSVWEIETVHTFG